MIIEVKKINDKVFKEYVEASSQFSFWQTKAMGERRRLDSWDYELLGFFQASDLVGAGLFYKRKVLNRYNYECMGGPIIDYSNPKPYFLALRKYLEANACHSCLINPNLTAYTHNIEAKTSEEQNDFLRVKSELNETDFNYLANTDANDTMFNWFYKKDISNFTSEDELLDSFERETKRLINNSMKMHLVYEELEVGQFNRLKNLVDKTADNKDFSSRAVSYYESLFNEFNRDYIVKMPIVKLDVLAYRKDLENEKAILIDKIANDQAKNTKKSLNRMVQSQDVLRAVENKLALIAGVSGDYIDLCTGVFLCLPDTITYLIGGSDNKYFSFNGPQFMQWHMLKYALANNVSTYDFYATRGSYINRPDEDGVYYFKKGFSGQLYENFGFYEYQANSLVDKFIRFVRKIR